MNNERKEYTITWFIENFSCCSHDNGEVLESPAFTAYGLKGTVWCLNLYPRGDRNSRSYISLFLKRCKFDGCYEDVSLNFKLSFLTPDESVLISREGEQTFKKGIGNGWREFVLMDEVLRRRKADFLPEDILCVRCKIWSGEGNVISGTQFNAVTRIGIEHMSFLHVVEDFSTLNPKEKKTMLIESPIGGELLSSSVYCSDLCYKGRVMIEIVPSSTPLILTKCKLSLIDVTGKLIPCCEEDNRLNFTKEGIKFLILSFTSTTLLNAKSEYLPDDKLSLLCECTVSTGIELQKLERVPHPVPLMALYTIKNKETYNAAERLSACTNALDDFKKIYNDLFLTDVELKTKTESFPAHQIVLCARSSVFKAMLTSDMKEKKSNYIQVDDLENDTVQQLLLFLYSDQLDNLQWESAIKLYYAGDKYDIKKLKVLCSSFLLDNLSTCNAPELLHLADTHNDSDLRKFVENFILEHEVEIYGSDEWVKLFETNSPLVFKMMCLKYKRNEQGEVNEE